MQGVDWLFEILNYQLFYSNGGLAEVPKKKLFSDRRWYGSKDELKVVKPGNPSPADAKKHEDFLKAIKELPDKYFKPRE